MACGAGSAALQGRPLTGRPRGGPYRGLKSEVFMHAYRSHTCGALRAEHAGQTARLSGWMHRKRDHGGLLFVDLRDHYGITQCVIPTGSAVFEVVDRLRAESVITVTGDVVARQGNTVNDRLPTGAIELRVREISVQSEAQRVQPCGT